jgi:ribonuclease HII
MIPTFDTEKTLYQKGYRFIAGADEVGRGAWAGPIVGAAVILPKNFACRRYGLKESKELSQKKRENFFRLIIAEALAYKISVVDNEYIDKKGISKANVRVLIESAKNLSPKPDYVLFDFLKVPFNFDISFAMFVHGDTCIASIAAASILAKVTRDSIMRKESRLYPHYAFEKHKGYGTPLHQAQLKKYGLCLIHRRSYSPMKYL